MKKLFQKIKMFCVKNRCATILFAVCIVAVIAMIPIIIVSTSRSELTKIEVSSPPVKTQYVEKQILDTKGLVVKAYYNKKSVIVTDYTLDKRELKLGDDRITVAFTDSGITKTAEFAITVFERSLSELEITQEPDRRTYIEHTYFDPSGIALAARYDNGESAPITNYNYDKVGLLQTTDKAVCFTYSEKGVTRSVEVSIEVVARAVTEIKIVTPPTKLSYLEGTTFDPTGLVIKAYFNNGEEEFVSNWEYDKGPLQVTDESVTITYAGKSVTVAIRVSPKILQAIMASGFPQKVVYNAGEYFDFLGIEIYASYENAPTELIKGWDYDKKEQLKVTDTEIVVSYTLHGITKTITMAIVVKVAPEKDPEQELIEKVLNALPPLNELTAENLSAIDYALSLLNNLTSLTPDQTAKKNELEAKRQEILDGMQPEPEAEYEITYGIANGLSFADINFGGNPTKYKNSYGDIVLAAASSENAAEQGYVFQGWLLDGQPIEKLAGLSGNAKIFAVFELTATTNVVFKDYYSGDELLVVENVLRTEFYDFEAGNIATTVYNSRGVLPVAYYSHSKIRISYADLSYGAKSTIFIITAEARELHITDDNSVTVGWIYHFSVGGESEQTAKAPNVGTVFVVPVGAEVTITALNANISDILVDGVSKGSNLNHTVVQAVFNLTAGEYPASVTFQTVISNSTTLSFVGYNQHSIVYPAGWDGHIAGIDLDTVAFIYDEANENYQTVYTIEGVRYYFDNLANYKFSGDAKIWVTRERNSFSFTVVYANGTESIEGLKGKQTLQAAFDAIHAEALAMIKTIFSEGKLFADIDLSTELTAEVLLSEMLRENITIYSDWLRPLPSLPDPPVFDDVDYSACSFVNTWNSLFAADGNILSSELVLTADGQYSYKTFINGDLSAHIHGVYRIEEDKLVLKTFVLEYDYQIVDMEDLTIDITFAADGLVRANFIELHGTELTLFEHMLLCGSVRPANYTGKDFLGVYQYNGAAIELSANGTAVITYENVSVTVYYRVTDTGQLFIFNNGTFGTGEIIDLLGGKV